MAKHSSGEGKFAKSQHWAAGIPRVSCNADTACCGPGQHPRWGRPAPTLGPASTHTGPRGLPGPLTGGGAAARLPPTLRGVLPRQGSREIRNKSDWNKNPTSCRSHGPPPPINQQGHLYPFLTCSPRSARRGYGVRGGLSERKPPFMEGHLTPLRTHHFLKNSITKNWA